MDEFLEELIGCIEYWCWLVQGEDFRSRAEVALIASFGKTWVGHDPRLTIEILTDFLMIEMLVAGSSVVTGELEVLPSELRVMATSVAQATMAAQARSRCSTDLVIFVERSRDNSYDVLHAFPTSQRAIVAAQFAGSALCELFDQVEEEERVGEEPDRTVNIAPLSDLLMRYLNLLIGLPRAIIQGPIELQ